MTGDAGTKIPEKSPGVYHCGTDFPGWLSGKHPTSKYESVADVKVCFDNGIYGGDCYRSTQVIITNCGAYFVYYLQTTPACNLGYCATN